MNQNIKEDFLDILLYLFEYYSEDPVRESDTSFVIRDHLIDAGFQDAAIDHAMDWVEIFKNPKEGEMLHTPSSSSIRILSDDEKNLLDVECQNYISRLEKFGLLTPEKRELLIQCFWRINYLFIFISVKPDFHRRLLKKHQNAQRLYYLQIHRLETY